MIVASGASLAEVLIDLKTRRKHLKNGLFFDPIRISRLYSRNNTQASLIEQINTAITHVSMKHSKKKRTKKSMPEHGLLYCDLPGIGWEAEDLHALGTTYGFLYRIGMRDYLAFEALSHTCNIGKTDWTVMGMTQGDMMHLQEKCAV
jgi:hypothetical protein